LNRAFRLAGTNFGHFLLSSFAAADATSASGPKADIPTAAMNVRFRGQSGHRNLRASRPLLTQSGHERLRVAAVQLDP
jgi:hypothetical protein